MKADEPVSDLQSLGISDEVLLELGRISWLAIHLEDWANSTCELILGEFASKENIGPHIKLAIDELGSWTRSGDVEAVKHWLERARELATRRNQILHSTPVRDSSTGAGALVHFPRSDKPPVTTPLDLATLQDVSEGLRAALSQWRNVYVLASAAKGAQRALTNELGIIEGEAADDDAEVVAGMARLPQLRDAEGNVPDLPL